MAARFSFWVKLGLALAIVALADFFFFRNDVTVGWTLGGLALALLSAVLLAHPESRRDLRARLLLGAAFGLTLILIDTPSPLAWLLFWISLTAACLSARAGRGDDAARFFLRLAWMGLAGFAAPLLDIWKLRRRLGPRPGAALRLVAIITLPLCGAAAFLALFAAANPLISQALGRLHLPQIELGRLIFWGVIGMLSWIVLRPRFLRRPWSLALLERSGPIPGVSLASVGASLVIFNLMFAIQNGLDIAFLWSGSVLPPGVTLADYAHRGAYPLIATALLAGLFVLVTLRPGSDTARSPWLRRLVVLWVVQTLILVASSMLRTWDYVEAYSLTGLRVAALLWMVLVAVGLALICWRMLRGKSASWLINANLAAAGLVLAGCCLVDVRAVAAEWNIRHARELGGAGAQLDLCYLQGIGDAAVVPLSELLARPLPPELRERAAWVRSITMNNLARRQDTWRGWSWRGARRLARAYALTPPYARQASYDDRYDRLCGGEPISPAPAAPPQILVPPAAQR